VRCDKQIKQKPSSPDLTGQLKLQRHTAAAIAEQVSHDHADEVICNIAGWKHHDYNGPYLTVELSPRFVARLPAESRRYHRFYIDEKEEDQY
jgi:hypothetical protein